jgi:hypothetical protein
MNKRKMMALDRLLGGGGTVSYSISGTVYDADGSTPVEGATVALGALSAVSAANGTYTINSIPPGTSGSMTCTKAGYSWVATSVSAMSGSLTGQNYTNWWWATGGISASCVAAYQPANAQSYASSKINIKNPGTNNATDGTAFPTWDTTNGWTFAAASSQFLKTGITPADNWSAIVKFSGATDGVNNQYLFGSRNASTVTRFFVIINSIANTIAYGLGDASTVSPELLSGILGFAAHQGYRNGVSDGAAIGAWTGGVGQVVFIGSSTSDGNGPAAATFLTGAIQAVAFFNTSIASQIEAMTANMATLPPNPS